MSVYATVVEFVDSVRNLGKITPDMYSQFMQSLNATGNRYEVTMEHRIRLYDINAYKNVYTTQIESALDNNDIYDHMRAGDYFYVSVQNITATPATVIKRVMYGNNVTDLVIMVPYGGMVQNDGR
jgi:hypothetical protein